MSSTLKNIFVCLLTAFMLSLVPYCANLRYPIDCQPMVSVVRSEAFATAEGTDFGYVQQCAMAAGVSESEYIANAIFIASAASGVNLANSNGVNYSYTPAQNLAGLIPSRAFPAWTGSESQVSAYGTELNYNAARFNSLMIQYGQIEPEDYNDYKANPEGHNMRESVKNWLVKFGDSAINTGGMLLGKIKSLFTNDDGLKNWLPVGGSGFVDGSSISNWPSKVPIHFEFAATNIIQVRTSSYYWTEKTGSVVCSFGFIQNNNVTIASGDKSPFLYKYQTNISEYPMDFEPNLTAGNPITYNGDTWYATRPQLNGTYQESTVPFYNVTLTDSEYKLIMHTILYGGSEIEPGTETIEGYPDNPSNNTLIIFPGSFNDNSTWSEILANQQIISDNVEDILKALGKFGFDADGCLYTFDHHLYDVAQNFNFYVTNGNSLLRVYDEQLIDKANDIYELLNRPTNQQVNVIVGDFDWPQYRAESQQFQASLQDVAPFCSIWLAKMVVDQIALVDPVADAKFSMPFGFFGESNVISIDLNFLDGARPFFNFFTIALLVLSLARGTMHFLNSELV